MSGAHPKLVAETEFKIEKGIALPASAGRTKYPFAQMEVGDSIFIPGGTTWGRGSSTVSAARKFGHSHNMTLQCRTVDGGVRIWRIA